MPRKDAVRKNRKTLEATLYYKDIAGFVSPLFSWTWPCVCGSLPLEHFTRVLDKKKNMLLLSKSKDEVTRMFCNTYTPLADSILANRIIEDKREEYQKRLNVPPKRSRKKIEKFNGRIYKNK